MSMELNYSFYIWILLNRPCLRYLMKWKKKIIKNPDWNFNVGSWWRPTNPAKLISVCKGRGTETPGHDAVLKDSQPLMSTREWAYAHSTLGPAWVSVEPVSSSVIVTGKLRGHSKKLFMFLRFFLQIYSVANYVWKSVKNQSFVETFSTVHIQENPWLW